MVSINPFQRMVRCHTPPDVDLSCQHAAEPQPLPLADTADVICPVFTTASAEDLAEAADRMATAAEEVPIEDEEDYFEDDQSEDEGVGETKGDVAGNKHWLDPHDEEERNAKRIRAG